MDGLQSQPAWRSPFSNQKLHETRSFRRILDPSCQVETGDAFMKYYRFEFEAGHSIGYAAKWSLFLVSCNNGHAIGFNKHRDRDSFYDADFLGLFLDKINSEGFPDAQVQDERFDTEFIARCKIEILTGNGVVLDSQDVETVPRDEIEEGYWAWRKVPQILKSCLPVHKSSKVHLPSECMGATELKLEARITFTISGYRKDLLHRIPSSHMNLLAKDQDFKKEISMTFYRWALSGKTEHDFVIEACDGQQFLVHKELLAARSPVFRRMFETSMTERALGKAFVDDISPESLICVLRHMYTGQVELEWLGGPKLASELIYASDKYWLNSLREYCNENLLQAATRKNCFRLLELASLHDLELARNDLTKFVQDNVIMPS